MISEKKSKEDDVFKHKHIIFCENHYNPLGIIRSLGEYGIRPIVIVQSCKKSFITKSKYISEAFIVNSVEAGYRLLLEKFKKEKNKPFLYTADDVRTSFLDKHYNELKNYFYFFNAGSRERITQFMNKNEINQLAIKHGLHVLDAVVVNRGEIPNDIGYPIITKSIASTIGGWKKDVFICNSENDLRRAYQRIQAPVVLLQRYIQKKNELCIDGFSYDRGRKVFYNIASNYKYVLPDTYSSYMNIFNFNNENLKKALDAMFEEVGFEGIFSVEFLEDENGEFYFCEINFRNSTWSYASTCAGMNLPVLWAQRMIGIDRDKDCIEKISADFTAMVEMSDFKTRVLGKKTGIVRWIRDFMRCDCRFYFAKNDFMPAFTYIFSRNKGR